MLCYRGALWAVLITPSILSLSSNYNTIGSSYMTKHYSKTMCLLYVKLIARITILIIIQILIILMNLKKNWC